MKADAMPTGYGKTGDRPRHSRLALVAGVGLALLALAGAITGSVLHLRQHVRAQIASRDGEILQAVAAMQYRIAQTNEETLTTLDDPGEQLQLALEISRMMASNVFGVRLFSPEGKFVTSFPPYVSETVIPTADLDALSEFHSVSHFWPRGRLAQVVGADTGEGPVALLQVSIPLYEDGQTRLAGVAQFLMNGTSIAGEYADLDRHLAWQATITLGISGSILGAALVLAFRRIRRANRLLVERTSSLLNANRELVLAAKTSAVGAVTSHLIHGLKNPLSGLQSFVRHQALEPGNGHSTDWQLAVTTTQRMQDLISRVVRVLQDHEAIPDYEVSLDDLAEIVADKLLPVARAAEVRLLTRVNARATLSNREADLVLLIMENLVQNALEATPAGRETSLEIFTEWGSIIMEVRDQGAGVPPELVPQLFTPCHSTKQGGSGIGLAISRQLAKHLGGDLELRNTCEHGSTFRLTLLRKVDADQSVATVGVSDN